MNKTYTLLTELAPLCKVVSDTDDLLKVSITAISEEFIVIVESKNGIDDIKIHSKGGVTGTLKRLGQKAWGIVSNPVIAGLVAGYSIDAYNQYKRNKRNMVQFLAVDDIEKKMYEQVVKDLMATNRYVKVKSQQKGLGYLWVLRRK